jgi:hypothetical protein
MSKQLQVLIDRVQQLPPDSAERPQVITNIATGILAQRQVSRPLRGQPLSGIYLETLQAAQQELQQVLAQTLDQLNLLQTSIELWSKTLRQQTFQTILNSGRLQQFALAAQQHAPKTEAWQYAVTELINTIRLSGRLAKPQNLKPAQYPDVENRTLLWVCEHLHSYDSTRGDFMKWVNYRLAMIAREIQQEQKDSYTQNIQNKLMRDKRQLRSLIQQTQPSDLQQWLVIYCQRVPSSVAEGMITVLVVLLAISALLSQDSFQGDALLFKIAEASIGSSAQVVSIQDLSEVETIAQPVGSPSLSGLIRQYIESDPAGLCQKAIRGYPEVTFQAIALSYLDGEAWKEMAQRLGPPIPTLSNHYQRTLKVLIPEIRQFVQDNF